MNLKNLLAGFFSSKASEARTLTTLQLQGRAISSPANYETFSRVGYSRNAIVFKCVHLVANACAGIELELYSKKNSTRKKKTAIENHPLLDLLHTPNPMQSGFSFIEALVAYRLITGNSFIESVKGSNNAPPDELWVLRPDRMKIVAGKNGYPAAYTYSVSGMTKTWPVDFVTMKAPVLHMHTFNPLNDWFGLSPLEAAMFALDSSNAANDWNLSMLQNKATPSGVLQVKESRGNPRGEISELQYKRIKDEFESGSAGTRNAHRPLILEGGLEWQQISLSPAEMDFINSKQMSAIELASVYGVPPEMLGLGVKTYNNYKEARQAFYEDTVLPLMDVIVDELSRWLVPMYGGDLQIGYCSDDIEALVEKRESKYTTLKDVNWLMLNEKRALTGQDEVEGGDIFIINNEAVEDLSTLIKDPNAEDPNAVDPNNPNPADPNAEDPNSEDQKPNDQPTPNDEPLKGLKSFNLITENDRRNNYKKQNRRRQQIEDVFKSALEKDFADMNKNLVEAATKTSDPRLVEYAMIHELSNAIKTFDATMKKYIGQTLREFGSMIFNEAKSDFGIIETKANTRKYEDFIKRYVETRTATAITQIEGTTKKKITSVVKRLVGETILDGNSNTELASQLQDEFAALSASRSQLIARTEVASASTKGSMEAVKALDVPNMLKEWVSVQDDRTRDGGVGDDANHLDMDGVRIPIDDKFTVPPDATMEAPGDSNGGADQVCNCRCTLVYKLAKPGANNDSGE